MKRFSPFRTRITSVAMMAVAVLLFSSMVLREYAHLIDHINHLHKQTDSLKVDFDHDAKFHYVTEAEALFDPHCWHQPLLEILTPLVENPPFAKPHLLPETRAPPAFS